jgi:hypothetical protein
VPTTAVGVAVIASDWAWGLFPMLGLPYWLALPAGVVALDLVIYLQHRIFHYVPALWRLHRMHHADLDIDVTTGVRFHPLDFTLACDQDRHSAVMLPSLCDLQCYSTPPRCAVMSRCCRRLLPPAGSW